MSDSLWPHRLPHCRPPCPSLSPRVCPNSCPLNWWCYPTILSPAVFFSFCLCSFQASGSWQLYSCCSVAQLCLTVCDCMDCSMPGFPVHRLPESPLTSVCKVMSLLFNMLSRFVIAFLPRKKCLLISWLWSVVLHYLFGLNFANPCLLIGLLIHLNFM